MGRAIKGRSLRRSLALAWRSATFVERRLGILGSLLTGAVLIVFGMLLTATLAGMLLGIPAMLFGVLLLLRALY